MFYEKAESFRSSLQGSARVASDYAGSHTVLRMVLNARRNVDHSTALAKCSTRNMLGSQLRWNISTPSSCATHVEDVC
jgi:hypothetical protein